VNLNQEFSAFMDSELKYRQHGYNDSGNQSNGQSNGNRQEPKPSRLSLTVKEPRLPWLVQAVTASRCHNCATILPPGTEFDAPCRKCGTQLHCCKQCANFESSTRFQCLRPIPARIAIKDQANKCTLFSPRVTVAREASGPIVGRPPVPGVIAPAPGNAMDARNAFARLFEK
jgi:hypothetical protein